MLQSRQASLPISPGRSLRTPSRLPTLSINVMSTFWRVLMAAWLATPELEDCKRRLPKNLFGGLKGLSAKETAMLLQDRLARGGILSTLDFSQCDGTQSFAPCSVLPAWQHQTRFIQWQGETLPQPLCGLDATSQACPLAPLALCTWILAETQDVAEAIRNSGPWPCQDVLQACYMECGAKLRNGSLSGTGGL